MINAFVSSFCPCVCTFVSFLSTSCERWSKTSLAQHFGEEEGEEEEGCADGEEGSDAAARASAMMAADKTALEEALKESVATVQTLKFRLVLLWSYSLVNPISSISFIFVFIAFDFH
jgi:hypothetical protein